MVVKRRGSDRAVIAIIGIIILLISISFSYNYIVDRKAMKIAAELFSDYDEGDRYFEFDPNTVTLPELIALGLTKTEAVSVIRYREYGKVFRIKEDLFTCYGISDSLYYALEPYIVIADTFRLKTRAEYESAKSTVDKGSWSSGERYKRKLLPISKFQVDTVGVKYLVAVGALSRRQAEVFVQWRNRSGIYNMDELRECYVLSDSVAAALQPYIIFPEYVEPELKLVDINKADSAQLRSVYGIGEKSVVGIIEYRQKLGGFYSVDQLSELKMVTESNFEKIIQQILCDSCDISKIDVNFASAKTMKGHPYIADRALRRLLKIRELKGGWSTVEEMIDDKIFTEEEATRVRPYLLFEEFETRQVSGDEFL